MIPEPELEAWRAAWRTPGPTEAPSGFDMQCAQHRQERRLRRNYLLNLAAAVLLIALAGWVLSSNFNYEALVWSIVVVLTTAGATAFQVWNWRTLWRTAARSVTDYADLYEQRCRATLRMVRFGYGLLALQLTIATPWLTWDFARHEISAARFALAMTVLALLAVGFLAQFRKTRRQTLQELAKVEDFRRELRD